MFKIAAGKKRDASVRPPRPRQTKERTEIFSALSRRSQNTFYTGIAKFINRQKYIICICLFHGLTLNCRRSKVDCGGAERRFV